MQSPLDPSNDLAARVIGVIAKQDETINSENIALTTTLKDLNLDSFGAVALMFDLEEEFAVELSDQKISSVRTVGDIVAMLKKLCEGHTANA